MSQVWVYVYAYGDEQQTDVMIILILIPALLKVCWLYLFKKQQAEILT
ncbi:MAG: hypothetical protein ACN4GM_01580 [Gammaproteobacteria bacterium]